MEKIKKKRGGQPNNKNAFLHGFYSAEFKARENRLLSETLATDLTGEIELIRVLTARYLESARANSQPLDPQTHLDALRAVTQGANAITNLIRLQKLRASADKKMDEMMEQLYQNSSAKPDDDVKDDDTRS